MTNSFIDLILGRPDLGAVERQRLAEEQFPSLVERTHMKLWRIGDVWPPVGEQVIWIGVGTFSQYDMELLDKLEAKLSQEPVMDQIFLSDTVILPDFRFDELLPGISKVYDVPVVGYWKEGVLEVKLSSAAGRDWVMRRFNLPPLRSIQQWDHPPPQ